MLICDVLLPCDGYIIPSDENNCVGTWALAWDALSKVTNFSCVGLSPEFLVFGVGEEVPHFHEAMRAPVLELRTVFRTIAGITKFVMASAAEAELAALFLTTREIVLLHQMLIKMGWPQPKKHPD
jgi:hypothetical protein